MTEGQFTTLIIVLMLGFGGAFAGGFTLGGVMIGIAIFAGLVLVCLVGGVIMTMADKFASVVPADPFWDHEPYCTGLSILLLFAIVMIGGMAMWLLGIS